MFLVPALLVALPQNQLAVVARFYKPGRAPSRFELYLDAPSGGRRKRLAMPEEPSRAVWVGPSSLLVQTERGWYFGRAEAWKPRLVRDSGDYNVVESRLRSWQPGAPEFMIDEQPNVFRFDPSRGKFSDVGDRPSRDVPLAETGPTEIEEPNGEKLSVEPFQYFSFQMGDKNVQAEYEFQRAWRAQGRLFVMTGTHSSGAGSINSLLVFEKGRAPRALFDEANNIDFHESRDLFAYSTPRTTSPLDPKDPNSKQVWSSELRVGSWRSGAAPKTLYTGAVHVSSVSISP